MTKSKNRLFAELVSDDGSGSTQLAKVNAAFKPSTTPEVTIVNSTHEDTDGGREGKLKFQGEQSGGELSTLAEIQGSHDGTADDQKGDLIFKTNDGSDGASPTEAMRIDSGQNITVTNNIAVGGTVDGRDLATDGTKLDGVAASANNYAHPNHSGEVTSTADGATAIASNVVDEDNLKVSNTPTNGYFLSAQSGNTGGLTWAAVPAGYANSDVDTHLNQSSASSGEYLQWNGSDYAWAAVSSVGGATGVDFNDSAKARFGTGNDLEIYHNGTDSAIVDTVSNRRFLIGGDEIAVRTGDLSEDMAKFYKDGAVELYYDNTKKLETTTDGIKLASSSNQILMDKNASGSSQIRFADAGTMKSYISLDAAEDMYYYGASGVDHIFYANGSEKFRVDSGGVDVIGTLTTSSNVGCNGNGSFGSTNSSGYRLLYYGSSYAGGNVNLQGNLTMTNFNLQCYNLTVYGSFSNYSDDRLKNKIGNISTPLDKISTLNGFYYTDSDSVTDLKKAENLQDPSDTHHKKESQQKVGLSAQEVQAVLPEVVKTSDAEESETDTEYLTLDYTRVIPLLVEGIKELKTKVETLETKVAALEAE